MAYTMGATFPAAPAIGDTHRPNGGNRRYNPVFRWDGNRWVRRTDTSHAIDIAGRNTPDVKDYYNSENDSNLFPNEGEAVVDRKTGALYVFTQGHPNPAATDINEGALPTGGFIAGALPINIHNSQVVHTSNVVPPYRIFNNGNHVSGAFSKGDIIGYCNSAGAPVHWFYASEDIPAGGARPDAAGTKWIALDVPGLLKIIMSVLPAFAAGDAGKSLKVNAAGDGLEWV